MKFSFIDEAADYKYNANFKPAYYVMSPMGRHRAITEILEKSNQTQ